MNVKHRHQHLHIISLKCKQIQQMVKTMKELCTLVVSKGRCMDVQWLPQYIVFTLHSYL